MVWNDKIKRAIPSGWTVASIINNPLTQVIKPGVDAFTTKEYLATAEVTGTNIASGSIIDYENREGRANMQPVVNSVWFAKMKNSIKHLFLNKYFLDYDIYYHLLFEKTLKKNNVQYNNHTHLL